jgi:hypothetical protein
MQSRTLWNTLKALITSRKWLAAASTFVVTTGVIVWSWDQQAAAQIAEKVVNVALVLSGLFIGATALEDAASKMGRE